MSVDSLLYLKHKSGAKLVSVPPEVDKTCTALIAARCGFTALHLHLSRGLSHHSCGRFHFLTPSLLVTGLKRRLRVKNAGAPTLTRP